MSTSPGPNYRPSTRRSTRQYAIEVIKRLHRLKPENGAVSVRVVEELLVEVLSDELMGLDKFLEEAHSEVQEHGVEAA